MQETEVESLGREDPLEEEMTTHSSIPAWKIPWTEEPQELQSRHEWATSTHTGEKRGKAGREEGKEGGDLRQLRMVLQCIRINCQLFRTTGLEYRSVSAEQPPYTHNRHLLPHWIAGNSQVFVLRTGHQGTLLWGIWPPPDKDLKLGALSRDTASQVTLHKHHQQTLPIMCMVPSLLVNGPHLNMSRGHRSLDIRRKHLIGKTTTNQTRATWRKRVHSKKRKPQTTINILRDIRDDTVLMKQNRMVLKITCRGKKSPWKVKIWQQK